MNIKKGDKVKVLTGKDRGKSGAVLKAMPAEMKVIVEGINMNTRHLRAKRQGEKGQKATVPAPMYVSKVILVCPKCGKTTRVAHLMVDNKKFRQCKKCKETI